MPKLQYLFPETPLSENSQPDCPLTSVGNQETAKDVYTNDTANTGKSQEFSTGYPQDKLALGSELEPSYFENPIAGGLIQKPIHCDTCTMDIKAEEISLPTHLGHDTRDADSVVYDVDRVHKIGGEYRIPWEVERNLGSNPNAFEETSAPIDVSDSKTSSEPRSNYAFQPKALEERRGWERMYEDGYIDKGANNGDVILADTDDRTVPM